MNYISQTYEQIDRTLWTNLVAASSTGTWFQTPNAYDFFASLPDFFRPFAIGVLRDTTDISTKLRGICVGYVTVEKNPIKQYFTRRAIIIGGPCLADDATAEEVEVLMSAVKKYHSSIHSFTRSNVKSPIYIETRNLNDYSHWKEAFEKAGFAYQPHLNFHVDTSSIDVVEANLGKSRKRDIRTSIREGASVIEHPTDKQVCEYYKLLSALYRTKVKTPLFPLSFFLTLNKHKNGRLLLIEFQGSIIGGTVCVEQTDKCLYEWFVCGEDGVYPHVFPSVYATYSGIQYAVEHKLPRFDMMGAGKPIEEYGVRNFKARFGGKEVEHGRFVCIAKPLLYKIGEVGVNILKMNISEVFHIHRGGGENSFIMKKLHQVKLDYSYKINEWETYSKVTK